MRKLMVVCVLFFSVISLAAKGDFHLFSIDNKDGLITPVMIEKAFTSNGFMLSVNSEMNLPFTKQFGATNFKIFNLMTVHHRKLSPALVAKYPQYGVFMPMSIGIFQGIKEDTLHVSLLTSDAQAKILGFDDDLLRQIETAAIKAIEIALPNAAHNYSDDSINTKDKLVVTVEKTLDDANDWKDEQEIIEGFVEGGLQPLGFVMPSYLDVNLEMRENGVQSPFDFYVTYSICKLQVIYTVSKTRPEASAFAPCTVMIYKKTGDDKVVLGFPSVYNWMNGANILDAQAREVLLKAQKDFTGILKSAIE